MEIAKYSPVRLPAELEEITYGPNRNSPSVTPSSQPSVTTSIAGAPRQGAIAGQDPSQLTAVSKSIENLTPTTGMILAPDRKNQIRAIHSAGFDANLQLPIDRNRVLFCMSYHLRGHCNDNCTRKDLAQSTHDYRNCTAQQIPRTVRGHAFYKWTNYT